MVLKETDKGWFQTQSDVVKKSYSINQHIKIVDEDFHSSNLCIIYFSSNEIYYPNTISAFCESIIKRNKFEWGNTKFPNAARHIYVRDIQKQWYLEGISDIINTPIKLLNELINLSEGFKIYTIGSSAGGFAAILFGSLLKAAKVYAFNAQLNLNTTMADSSNSVDPILFKHQNNLEIVKYYNLSNFVTTNTDYYYFQSAYSKMDIKQFEAFDKKEMITRIGFKTKNHGFPFLRHNLSHVLKLSDKELKQLSLKIRHPFLYSVSVDGIYMASNLTMQAIFKRMKKKLYDERKNS